MLIFFVAIDYNLHSFFSSLRSIIVHVWIFLRCSRLQFVYGFFVIMIDENSYTKFFVDAIVYNSYTKFFSLQLLQFTY
jgi:hypothetical protein